MLVYQSLPEHLKAIPTVTGISGFWRRILAFLVDIVLLVVTGYLLTYRNLPMYAKMGRWGCLVGYGLTMAYFGLLNSRIGRGQTLGKRLVQIQVVGEDGQFISPGRSFLRAGLLVSFHLLGPLDPSPLSLSPLHVLYMLLSTALPVGIISLYLFNRHTRQGLHDLITHTCVVGSATQGAIDLRPVARVHYAVSGALTVLGLGVLIFLVRGEGWGRPVRDLMVVQQAVNQFQEVRSSSAEIERAYERDKPFRDSFTIAVSLKEQLACACSGSKGILAGMPDCQCDAGTSIGRAAGMALDPSPSKDGEGYRYDPGRASSEAETISSRSQACACAQERAACPCTYQQKPGCPCALSVFTDRVAQAVLENYPSIDQKEKLTIHVDYGYNIGICSAILPQTFAQSFSPSEWRQRLTTRPLTIDHKTEMQKTAGF